MAMVSNLYIDAGADYAAIVTAKRRDGRPISLVGQTAKAQFRKHYESEQFYEFDVCIVDSLQGQIALVMEAAKTELIPPGRYMYDVEITASNGCKERIIEGLVVVSPGITRS